MQALTEWLERLAVAINLKRVNFAMKVVLTILFATLITCTLVRIIVQQRFS